MAEKLALTLTLSPKEREKIRALIRELRNGDFAARTNVASCPWLGRGPGEIIRMHRYGQARARQFVF